MSGPRLSSVYDFSSLRLHPDGSRVQQNTSKNLRPRYAASAVQDPRGNWFARDAAGFGTIGRYRKVREEADGEEVDPGEDGQELSRRKGKGKAKERIPGRRHNPRPAKRQKFLHDLDFLAPSTSSSSSSEYPLPSSVNTLCPSADLLKSIHYFASTYYHERGQLINLTKEYRQMRKQRRLLRLEQQEKVETARETSEGYEKEEDSMKPVRRGGRVKGAGKRTHPKDMYKVLDGSALVAIGLSSDYRSYRLITNNLDETIGMLMQEYVARMLEVRIPDGWEDMIQQAYANVKEDTPEAEDEEDFGNIEGHDAQGSHSLSRKETVH
ncbi:hypothetical protein FPV67DRAFT_1715388 [Lyophyllum atratum]|nr:hypothetical protein FPV67DRAFT_1715388 [Lyophyllum atratum]